MLFINGRGNVRSVVKSDIPVPFVRERFEHGLGRVQALLASYRYDPRYTQALAEELTHKLGSVPSALPYPAGVIDVGERAIADALIEVASALPEPVELTFDMNLPSMPHEFDAVMFASPAIATDFLVVVLGVTGDQAAVVRGADNRTALGAALEHPAGQRYAGVIAGEQSAASATDGGAALVQRTAALLTRRCLALLPRDLSRRRLRLAWLEHQVPSVPVAKPSAPSRAGAAPPAPPLPTGPVSVLPDAPTELTPQVQTLIEAAQNGAPFCEECARRAAEQELAGV
jgi:hypothetical protein